MHHKFTSSVECNYFQRIAP